MVSMKSEFRSTPSNRILQLAQPKESKSVWVTTPGRKLTWGNQEPIWPLTLAALLAVPSPRLQALAQHKKDFSAFHQELLRKGEEGRMARKMSCSSPHRAQYDHVVRLATPRSRFRSSQEVSPLHSEWCEYSCAVGHISSSVRAAVISPRLLHLARPKSTHPDFTSNRQTAETNITHAAKKVQASPRLQQLCLPRLRESKLLYQHGPPESPIWPVSKAALSGSASSRVMALSTPKSLSKDYVPPREQIFL